jgi:hypothetical protein
MIPGMAMWNFEETKLNEHDVCDRCFDAAEGLPDK